MAERGPVSRSDVATANQDVGMQVLALAGADSSNEISNTR